MEMFNNLKLATRIVTITLAILFAVVAVNYVVFTRGYNSRAQDALVEKAKAFTAVADEAKNHASLLHQTGAFNEEALATELSRDLAAGKRVDETRFFKTIPVVAGWTAAQDAAQREHIEFRISSFDARNKDHEPKPGSFEEGLLRKLSAQVVAGQGDFIQAVDKTDNSLHFLRAIRLTENCLMCHGAPGSKWDKAGTGKDPTGHAMESWVAGQMHGSYHVVMPLAPVRAQVASFILNGLLWTLPLAGVAIAFFVSVIWRSIGRPVKSLTERTTAIANGDLTQEMPGELRARGDEIGALAKALANLRSSLIQSLQEVGNSTGTLTVMSEGLVTVSQRLTEEVKGTMERSNAVATAAEEASASSASVATGMQHASENLSSVAGATEEMSATVADIASNSAKARAVSEEAGAQARAVAALMHELGQAAQEIGKVTETITGISDQTKLLALNATIEAARAGTAGKGFAVVAHEIKELARQTAAATEDIKTKILGVQTSTGGAITEIEKITAVIADVVGLVTSIAAAIEEQATVTKDVASNVGQASTSVREANEQVAETATVSKSIARDVTEISAQSRAIGNDSRHLQENADMLKSLAERFKQLISRFEMGKSMDFVAIKKGHLQWRNRVVDLFEGRQTLVPSDVVNHHQCALGKWYDNEGRQHMGHLHSFGKLEAPHAKFHSLIGDVVTSWNAGRQTEAMSRFQELMPLTNQIFENLDDLSLESAAVARNGNSNGSSKGNGNGNGNGNGKTGHH